MSHVSVVQYNMSPQKLNILQQNTNTNYVKPDDRHILILRKPPPILPQPKDYSKDDILITNPGRKGIKKSGGKELKTNPQPIAVARRNARERNRVKQVNTGFATLRQHIPNFIAQAFESSNGRGNKKLSKVETLRMAVEYIRSLEDILTINGDQISGAEIREKGDMASCPSPISTISQNDSTTSQNDMTYNFMMSPSEDDDDDFSSVATSSPQQYIRINTSTNTYEIIPSNLYENTENMDPMSIDQHHLLSESHLLHSGVELSNQNLSYLQVNALQTANGSLSPGMYSEGSISPKNDPAKIHDNPNQNCFIPVFATAKLGQNFNVHIKTEDNNLPVISLKAENCDSEPPDGLDVMSWWEQTQARHSHS